MAVMVSCANPQGLLNKIKSAIQGGTVQTWSVDSDGDFTHTPEQWRYEAWFRPSIEQDKLVFFVLGKRTQAMSKAVYGVYHGRLIEMLLTHFDVDFTQAIATALPMHRDWVRPPAT
jgi:hypothetical protein